MHNYTTLKQHIKQHITANQTILYYILYYYYIIYFAIISLTIQQSLICIFFYFLFIIILFFEGVALSVDFVAFFVCARFGWLPGGVVVAFKRSFLCMALFLGALAGAPPLFFGKVVQGRVTPPLDTRSDGRALVAKSSKKFHKVAKSSMAELRVAKRCGKVGGSKK